MISRVNLFVCLFYGILSTCQTLNSRFLFRTLEFNFYSFAFFVQRIVNIIVFLFFWKTKFRTDAIKTMLPYTLLMCTTNILSSYCVTVLPLAAFMAFKKFIVFFVLIIACICRFPHSFNNMQYTCIFFIVLGGVLVGERDIFLGDFIGYLAAIAYNLCEAGTLEYQSYMRRVKKYQPEEVFLLNSALSLPYYMSLMVFENEFSAIGDYFSQKTSLYFGISFGLLLVLACLSEFTASYIAMKISPFEKATVSNIKDIVLTFISVYYFRDFILSLVSEMGIFFCLSASLIFSYTLLQKGKADAEVKSIEEKGQPLGQEEDLSVEDRIQRQLQSQEETQLMKK